MSSIGENVHARLSMLPEEIITHILSLMPTEYAVKTSVLSKSWRYSWMLLKNLDVVARQRPFVNTLQLICGCPVLESLSLKVIIWKKEEDYIFNIPTLKRLKLRLHRMFTSLSNKLILNLPNLEYLSVRGLLGPIFVMEDVSSLVEASVSRMASDSLDSVKSNLQCIEFLNGIVELNLFQFASFFYTFR
ncbi:uncharacterized protein LOC143618341 [Bidens hawaiensis]|uniref:uncharacterized protein LOC143618341 n=1 Tax=Bidens hawaiensis TaxID=980011 RepID=UPI0040497EEE